MVNTRSYPANNPAQILLGQWPETTGGLYDFPIDLMVLAWQIGFDPAEQVALGETTTYRNSTFWDDPAVADALTQQGYDFDRDGQADTAILYYLDAQGRPVQISGADARARDDVRQGIYLSSAGHGLTAGDLPDISRVPESGHLHF